MYLRGRQYLRALGTENVELARQMFKRAVALDASFAQPHAGIADCDVILLQWLSTVKEQPPELRGEALAESDVALRLDPALPEAYAARGNALFLLGRNQEADQAFRRAVELGPGSRDAWYWYARFLFATQRYADSAAAFEATARANPDDYDALTLLAMPYYKLNQPEKARAATARALDAAERALRSRPDDVRALYLSGASQIQLGQVEKGFARLEQAVALRPHDFTVLYNAACGNARAGRTEQALDLLDRAVGTGQGFRAWLEQDPDLDSLHGSQRFQQILARLPQ
jgi:adenylate cyclase